MKLKQAAEAFLACEELAREKLSYGAAMAVYLTRKRTEELFRFYAEKERELIEAYAERDEAGALRMAGSGVALRDAEGFRREKQALLETEAAWEHEVIRCAAPKEIRPMQLAALEGFIDFEEEDT